MGVSKGGGSSERLSENEVTVEETRIVEAFVFSSCCFEQASGSSQSNSRLGRYLQPLGTKEGSYDMGF